MTYQARRKAGSPWETATPEGGILTGRKRVMRFADGFTRVCPPAHWREKPAPRRASKNPPAIQQRIAEELDGSRLTRALQALMDLPPEVSFAPRGPLDREGAPALPKPRGRLRSVEFMAFVRTKPCCSCGKQEGVQAHHHGPRPVGRKTDDYRCVPLCAECHGHFHDTARLPGRDYAESREHLLAVQVDLLIEFFAERG